MLCFFYGKYVGVEWLGLRVDVCLTFQETAKPFQSGYTTSQCYILTYAWKISLDPCSHSDRLVAISHVLLIHVSVMADSGNVILMCFFAVYL